MGILVVDDHILFRDAVAGILDQLANEVSIFGAAPQLGQRSGR